MDTKNKPGQKGGESHTKQPTRPGTEQVRSGTGLERERPQSKVAEPQKQHKEGQIKGGKK